MRPMLLIKPKPCTHVRLGLREGMKRGKGQMGTNLVMMILTNRIAV